MYVRSIARLWVFHVGLGEGGGGAVFAKLKGKKC